MPNYTFLLKQLGRLSVVLMAVLLIFLNQKFRSEIGESVGKNRYCVEHSPENIICRPTAEKAKSFLFIYYDGLPKMFLNFLQQQSPNKGHIILNRIEHVSVSDSIPAFYTYSSGRVAFNYEGDLDLVDNLFKQFEIAGKNPQVHFYPKMAKLFGSSGSQMRLDYSNELVDTLSTSFLDWPSRYFFSLDYEGKRIDDNLIYGNDEKKKYFLNKLEQFREKIQKKKSLIELDLDYKFSRDTQNLFVYIPILDNFTHSVTMSSKRYLSSVAMIVANLEILVDYIAKKQEDKLLVVLSDHGGDESIEEQEKRNHADPNSTIDNSPFLMLVGQRLRSNRYNSNAILKSTEVASIIAFHIDKMNIPMFAAYNPHYFRDVRLQFQYYLSYKAKELELYSRLTSGTVAENHDLANSKLETLSSIFDNDDQSAMQTFIQKDLDSLNSISRISRLNLAVFRQPTLWIVALTLVLLLCLLLIWPIKKLLFYNRSSSLNEKIMIWHLFIIHLFGLILFLVDGNPNESMFLWLICLYFVSGTAIEVIFQSRISYLTLFSGLGAVFFIFRQISESNLRLFYNQKDLTGLVIGFAFYAIWQIRYLTISPKSVKAWIPKILSLANIAAIVKFDWLTFFAVDFDPTNQTKPLIQIFIVLFILQFGSIFFFDLDFGSEILRMAILQLCFWMCPLHDRLLYTALVLPFFLVLKTLRKRMTALQQPKYPLNLAYAIMMAFYFEYLVEGYKFDWNNRRRLLFKFDFCFLFRTVHQVFASFLIFDLFGPQMHQRRFWKLLNFIYGVLFVSVCINLQWEQRMASTKFFENSVVGFCFCVFFGAYSLWARNSIGKKWNVREEKSVASELEIVQISKILQTENINSNAQ